MERSFQTQNVNEVFTAQNILGCNAVFLIEC
jgi:hypothetical protein